MNDRPAAGAEERTHLPGQLPVAGNPLKVKRRIRADGLGDHDRLRSGGEHGGRI